MKLPKSFTKVTPLSKALAMILFVLLPFAGFYLGLKYQIMMPNQNQFVNQNQNESSKTQQSLVNNCQKNSDGSLDDFLVKYTVKPGDSLLSIAKNELGDPSRIQEIAVMNGDKYSGFFSSAGIMAQNPFLEQGWVLSLPPKWITNSSGQLDEINGFVFKAKPLDNTLYISANKDQSGWSATITLDNNTINNSHTVFKEGDCITAIRDIRLNKILKINLQ